MILNETRLDENDKHLYNIPGFQSFHATRKKPGGGVSIFINNSLSSANLLENFEFENNNFLAVKLVNVNLSIIGIYKPPDTNCSNFLVELDKVLERNPHSVVFGDFNLNLFDSKSPSILNYNNTLESNGFKFLNCISPLFFTRLNPSTNSSTCIDHIFTDEFLSFNFILAIDDILNVDHKALMLSISRPNFNKQKQNKYFTYTKINHSRIINSNMLLNTSESSFSDLIRDFRKVLKSNTQTFRVREKFRKSFMDLKTFNFMQIRDNYFKMSRKYPNSHMARERFKLYRNKVTTLLRENKRKFNDDYFVQNNHDGRKVWRHLNNIVMNRDSIPNDSCNELLINGKLSRNKSEIAQQFNHYFINAAPSIKNSLSPDPTSPNNYKNFIPNQINVPFECPPSSENEILSIISNMKSSNALDYYDISNNLLKTHKKQLAAPISSLINKCIREGNFPSELKLRLSNPFSKVGINFTLRTTDR